MTVQHRHCRAACQQIGRRLPEQASVERTSQRLAGLRLQAKQPRGPLDRRLEDSISAHARISAHRTSSILAAMQTGSAGVPLPDRVRAAVDALADRPIASTEKGFGVISAGRTVSSASLAAERPDALGADFTMPLLVLRDSALRHNALAMADWCAAAGVELAPHGKTTMAPQLIARQLAAGAWGVTAATISQVQVFRAFGMQRVLLANQLTDPAGIRWLAAELAADPDFECYVYVDSPAGVALLDLALRTAAAPRPLGVLVELGFPGGRTGCRTVDDALATAAAVA